MTTRRDVLIGIAGVAAAAAVPVKIIEKIPTWTNDPSVLTNGVIFGGPYSPLHVGDLISMEYDGSVWRVVCVSETSFGLEPIHAGDLEEGAEYTLHLT